MSIRSKIQAIITAANTKTGESDTTLTDAVQTLVDGYGQGGGGSQIVSGTTTFTNRGVGATFTHNAGVSDYIFVLAVPPTDFEDLKSETTIAKSDAVFRVSFCSSKFAYINQKTQGFDSCLSFKPSDGSYTSSATNVNSAAALYAQYTNNSVTYLTSFGFHPTTYKWWVIPITALTV